MAELKKKLEEYDETLTGGGHNRLTDKINREIINILNSFFKITKILMINERE